jgi:hypothetical protein
MTIKTKRGVLGSYIHTELARVISCLLCKDVLMNIRSGELAKKEELDSVTHAHLKDKHPDELVTETKKKTKKKSEEEPEQE